MLRESTFWGIRDKVQIAIERFRQFEPAEGYWLAFSGGKDSITIKRLAELAGVKFTPHFSRTTVDPPELEQYIKEHHPDVVWHRPELSMFQLILQVKFWPPMRQQRWCCELLKETQGTGTVALGVRWAESWRRQSQKMISPCYSGRPRTMFRPIIDWTDADVWQFIREGKLPYCRLYDEGFTRIGCILCPMECHPQKDIERWPKFAAAYLRTFDKLLEVRATLEKETRKFKTGQELFDWWIRRNTKAKNPYQETLFG